MSANDDRRAFLLKLAKTATYSAPLIRTMATPAHAAAQGLSQKMMMNMMMMNMMNMDPVSPFSARLPRAPWSGGGQ